MFEKYFDKNYAKKNKKKTHTHTKKRTVDALQARKICGWYRTIE